MWLKLAEKIVDFLIASGVTGTAVLFLSATAFFSALGVVLFRAIGLVREVKRQREAARVAAATPSDDDPTLPIHKGIGGYSPAIVVAAGAHPIDERRAAPRRSSDATTLQLAANASAAAEDARSIAETAEHAAVSAAGEAATARQLAEAAKLRVGQVETKLDKQGGFGDRLAVLEATCDRMETKVDQLPTEIVARFEQRLSEQIVIAARASIAGLEARLEQLVGVEVAKQLAARGEAATR